MHKISTFLFNTISSAFAAVVAIALIISGCSKGSHVSDKNVFTFTNENFPAEVLESSQPVLVDFWASWCGPCKVIAPTVAELATEFDGKAKFGKVNVDEQKELAQEYNISAIPALLIFKDGKVVEQFIGVQPKAKLEEALSKLVNTPATPQPGSSL